ncbi:hypothetical protein V1477_004143 [Vespula maculifrons]|uniref:Uncharacterized protein n=1 Tax=Vespula maculifrons TaxID=7453 RepID=A0ABD2CR26_VESMC
MFGKAWGRKTGCTTYTNDSGPLQGLRSLGREEAVSWIQQHLDTSLASLSLWDREESKKNEEDEEEEEEKEEKEEVEEEEEDEQRREERRGKEEKERSRLRERLLSMVIYRPEPSPSLTPLLRNYTQSVANKSKKVEHIELVKADRKKRTEERSPTKPYSGYVKSVHEETSLVDEILVDV